MYCVICSMNIDELNTTLQELESLCCRIAHQNCIYHFTSAVEKSIVQY